LGLSLKYQFKWNSADIQCYVTSKNLLNAYQPDYDRGIDRDPSYMYGPVQPRSLSIGFKVGNILN
jgi:outer membrane receptor for ferrienterochelin and colicins